jgi:hypothetical protein
MENYTMTSTKNLTQTQRVLASLQAGRELTAKQIAASFKIASPTSVIAKLRSVGYPIYLNERKDTKGRVTNKYRLGTPKAYASQM